MHQVSACCRYSLKYQWSGSIACTTVVDIYVTCNKKYVVTVVREKTTHMPASVRYCSHAHMYANHSHYLLMYLGLRCMHLL